MADAIDDLMKADEHECAALMGQFEAAIVATLNQLSIPPAWAIVARYFVIATLLQLATRLMVAALTSDPDTRHHARYVGMLAEASRQIAPWARGTAAAERLH